MGKIEEANEFKLKGNQAFGQHDWLNAVEFYTKAIEANDKDPSFYCNRAQVLLTIMLKPMIFAILLTVLKANIKLESYGYAIADASKAIELDGSYVKVSEFTSVLFSIMSVKNFLMVFLGFLETGNCEHCGSELP